ncbi:MAG: AbrB/MazE/SpoVT family DNA-binding domain-containing protein [Crenarchaeota archaeon]|nr:AbrB/MazE/SpoVT family DNA-binding domain-containing protein [Thermoproteota archaeon]
MRETRRIQLTGGGSYVISLPKDWVRLHGLGKGDTVVVYREPDGSLRILPPARSVEGVGERAVVQVPSGARFEAVVRRIISYYMAGVDVIRVVFPEAIDTGLARRIRSFINSRLIGVEVVEESAQSITVQSIVNDTALPLSASLKRLLGIVRSMLTDISTALKESSRPLLEEIVSRDDLADKFYLYVSRQVMKLLRGLVTPGELGVSSLAEASLYASAAKILERMADHASSIADSLASVAAATGRPLPGCMDKTYLQHYSSVLKLYREAARAFTRQDSSSADEIITRAEELRREGRRVYAEASCIEDIAVLEKTLKALESTRRLIDYTIDLMEVLINMSVVKSLAEHQPT